MPTIAYNVVEMVNRFTSFGFWFYGYFYPAADLAS
jgi:hypothetical protein